MRYIRSDWFSDRSPFDPNIAELFKIGVFLPLKVKDAENRQIVIIRTCAHDPKRFSFPNVLKVRIMEQ